MKKIINDANNVIEEMFEGFMAAYKDLFTRVPDVNGFVMRNKKDKVALVVGGGSGHEPLFAGFVGEGMADAYAGGNIFASPNPITILEVIKAADCGKGVLLVYGNYAGDILNFEMAVEMSEEIGIKTRTVRVMDDVSSAPIERMDDRRGIAGDIFVMKIAGAATALGLSLDEAARITEKARDRIRSIGVALSPGSIPGENKPQFALGDDEIEFGMGLHGEPGIKRTKMMQADDLTAIMLEHILQDITIQSNNEVAVLINGLGSTTLLELFIMNRKLTEILNTNKIIIYDTYVDRFCTTQEMAGASITLMLLDEELKKYYNYPANTPYFSKYYQ